MTTETIYAFFDGPQIQEVLNGVVMIVGSGSYTGLLQSFALIGMFVAIGTGFAKARGEDAFNFFIILAIWYGVMLVPTTSVDIHDNALGGDYTVANVPLGLAVFAGEESNLGNWLATEFDTVFSTPSAINYVNAGPSIPGREVTEAMNMTFSDPNLNTEVSNFTINCVFPELLANPALEETVFNSNDIWSAVSGQTNPARFTTVISAGTNVTESCPTAYTDLTAQMANNISSSLLGQYAMAIYPESNNTTIASNMIAAQSPASENLITGASQDTATMIRQSAMINMLGEAGQNMASQSGDVSDTQVAIATAQAESSANSAYLTTANMARELLPIMHSVVNVMIIALFPLMMVIAVMAGVYAGKVIKTYAMMLLWVNLWPPIYVLVSEIGTWYSASSASGGIPPGVTGLTYTDHVQVVHSLLRSQSVISSLLALVPFIAWMIIKGADSAISEKMAAGALSAAGQAGAQAGAGNFNVGNDNWGNVSTHNVQSGQWNTAPTNVSGAPTSTRVGADGWRTTTAGSGYDAATTVSQPMNQVAGGASVGSSLASQLSQQASSAMTAARADMHAASTAESAVLTRAADHTKALSHQVGSGTGAGQNVGGGYGGTFISQSGHSYTAEQIQQFAKEEAADLKAGVSGNVGVGTPGGSPVGGKAGINAGLGKDYKARIQHTGSANQSDTGGRDAQLRQQFIEDLNTDSGFRDQVLGTDGSSRMARAALQTQASKTQSAQAELRQAQSLTDAASQVATTSSSGGFDPFKTANADDIKALMNAVKNNPGHAADIIGNWMSSHGFHQGSQMPTTLAGGSATPTAQSLQAKYQQDTHNVDGSIDIGRQHQADIHAVNATVPVNLGTNDGAGSAGANANRHLVGDAQHAHDTDKASVQQQKANLAALQTAHTAEVAHDTSPDAAAHLAGDAAGMWKDEMVHNVEGTVGAVEGMLGLGSNEKNEHKKP